MKKTKKKKRIWRWGVGVLLTPLVLFLLLSIAVYIPPVQRFVVAQAAEGLKDATGIDVSVEKVRLAFPLDLAVHGVVATDKGETLADIRALRVDVRMWPLFKGDIDVDGLTLFDAQVDTKDWIADVYLRGHIGKLSASSHGVDLSKETVVLDKVELNDAKVYVALSDTAAVDTTTSSSKWDISTPEVIVKNTEVKLSLPGDSMRIALRLGDAKLTDGHFDTGKGNYGVERLRLRDGAFAYAVRSFSNDGRQGNKAFWANDSVLWVDSIPAAHGIDPNYIVLNQLDFQLDTLNYLGDGSLSAGLRNLMLGERSGLRVDNLSGKILMDNRRLQVDDFEFRTPTSRMDLKVVTDWAALKQGKGGQANLSVDANFSPEDIRVLAIGIVDSALVNLWPDSTLDVEIETQGNVDRMQLDQCRIDWPGILQLNATGDVLQPMSDLRKGKVQFDLRTLDMKLVKTALSKLVGDMFTLPANLSMTGELKMNEGRYSADIQSLLDGGHFSLNGGINLKTEKYDAVVSSSKFPLHAFLPTMGLGALTADVEAAGQGFDLTNKRTKLQTKITLDTLRYDKWQLGRVSLDANLDKGKGVMTFASANDVLEGEGTLETTIDKNFKMKLRSDLSGVNLKNIMGLKDTLFLGVTIDLNAYTDKYFKDYGVGGALRNTRFVTADKGVMMKDLLFSFITSKDTTRMWTSSGDLDMRMSAAIGAGEIAKHTNKFLALLQKQIVEQKLDQTALKKVVPSIDIYLRAGVMNPLGGILRYMGYDCNSLYVDLNSSPAKGIDGDFRAGAFVADGITFDTIRVKLEQDTTGLVAYGWLKNYKKKNPNKFEASLKSYLLNAGAGIQLVLKDREGKKSMDLGVRADLVNNGISVNFYPEKPIIAYRNFTVNKRNYIFLDKACNIKADVDLLADDGTGFRLYGQPADSVNDVTLSLNKVNLTELSEVLPFMPKLGGMFSGDFHVTGNMKELSAMASVNTEDLMFEGAPLGNVGAEVIYLPKGKGEHYANAYISSEGNEVLALDGQYSEKGNGEFHGVVELLQFPMTMINGFLAGSDIVASGSASGRLLLDGELGSPVINGNVSFADAHLYSDVYGIDFRMDEVPIKFDNNQLVLNNYALHSKQSDNPLLLNGGLDMRDFSNIRLNLDMLAKNFELINTKKKSQSLVFGKVYADFSGSLRGSLDDMYVRGRLDVLNRTDVTYILKDSPLTVDDRLHDLVQFVSFEDSVEVVEKTVPAGSIDMTMIIGVSDAAVFHCNLSEDGQNYVDLEGGGDLTLRLTQQGDMRLTGRFTANSGEMKYSLPVIPLKTFKLEPGSYVDFTGDVANPTLNIIAKERVKATVTENDQPRSVAFDVGVSITQPLERMGLEFIISAPEDLAVQNKLTAMTKAERGKTAVAMLATGMYLTDESLSSGGTGFKASNALTAFLQSEIQNIAGNALKTIDLSIGMENNTTATGATTTDYSFQFAKRFWGNRISVIVGGKVSTGAEAENSAESFIDNIAVEYRLDKSASRYIRVFYDRGVQDPLEGQLTKTGAGLVLRKKSNRLGELFIFRNKKSKKEKNKQ